MEPLRVVFWPALVILFASCTSEEANTGGATGSTCPTVDAPTYESFGQAFMESYCTDCHGEAAVGSARKGAPSDHNFDTLEGVMDAAEHIDEYAASGPEASNDIMPPDGPQPSEEERRRLGEWIACELENAEGSEMGGSHH